MAGVGAREIKRKIRSVGSTMQITKAMELVSTAKLRRTRENMEKTRPYFNEILSTVGQILAGESVDKHNYMPREVKSSLVIVITSDKGLCGGYNANAIREAEEFIKAAPEPKLITIGRKACDYFSKRGYNVVRQISKISEAPEYSDAVHIAKLAVGMYDRGEVDEISIVYTKLISTLTQVASTIWLIPVDKEEFKVTSTMLGGDDTRSAKLNYEPSVETVMNYLIPKYVEGVIYGSLVESAVSEQASRRNAMESATNSAQEMIDELTLLFNRARQGAITQEINEIVGGANALEG